MKHRDDRRGAPQRLIAAVTALTAISACASAPPPCAADLESGHVFELYFGTDIPAGGEVSEADWAAYLDDTVTPRFPDGFSVLEGYGQYRMSDGTIVAEDSKMLTILASDPADARESVEAVRAAYVARFGQEAVLLIEHPACFAF